MIQIALSNSKTQIEDSEMPPAFALCCSLDERVDFVMLVGICERCAAQSDAEFLNHASKKMLKEIDGVSLGFETPGPERPR